MSPRIPIPHDRLEAFCRKWGIAELALFGSVLRDDFGPDSDIDALVRFAEGATPSLFEMVEMEQELAEIFQRKVDLISRRGVEQGLNQRRKNAILDSAEVIFAG